MSHRKAARTPRIAAALLAVLGLLLAGCSGNSVSADGTFALVSPGGKSEFSYPQGERKPLGEIAGPAVDSDKRISVADYPGKVVVLNFWGAWCSPCRGEADDLATAAKLTANDGVQFIGINVREASKQAAADFEKSFGVPYPSIFDQQARTLLSIRGFPATAIPSTIVLDRQHRVAYVKLGAFDNPAPLVETLKKIAAEQPPAGEAVPANPAPSQAVPTR
ncbi:TlpA disulfide reductase family protein [Nakamurella aerolata]|uniref:TlpA family protein disulfide reductase n=1 Tax=Nakamurella aerolata TaxID=1656892 RepID=A0A849A7E3_9ACTN|nr:TlpA disulfide reductase family protein [Nakamurella aerolata]NNG35028.1 TlpA family protein disulfide reductase [Nakamurella aerolata]